MSPAPLSSPYDVLVVDDSAAIRGLVAAAFAKLPDYQIRTAATVDEGRAQLRARVPDVLLLDCQLDGGASGVDVLAASPVASAPITIVFSASADDANTLFNRFEQVVSRMLKPFHPSELVEHVREAIKENQEALEFVRNLPAEPDFEPSLAVPPPPVPEPVPRTVVREEFADLPASRAEEFRAVVDAGAVDGSDGCAPVPRPILPPPQLTGTSAPAARPLGDDGAADEPLHPLAAALLAHPDVRRALNQAVRGLFPDAEAPLACGEGTVLHPATLIGWARRRREVLRLRSQCDTELCDVWFAGGRVVGVATAADGRRGHPAPAKHDLDGQAQENALQRVLMMPPGQYLEARAFAAPPAWTMMQTPAALERLSRFIGT